MTLAYLDVALLVEDDIFKFEITEYYSQVVDISQSEMNLRYIEAGLVERKPARTVSAQRRTDHQSRKTRKR